MRKEAFHLRAYLSFHSVVDRVEYCDSTTTVNDRSKPTARNAVGLILERLEHSVFSAEGKKTCAIKPGRLFVAPFFSSLHYFRLDVVVLQIHLPPVRTLSRLTILRDGVGRYVSPDNICRRPPATLYAFHSPRMVKRSTLDRGRPDTPSVLLGVTRKTDSLGRVNPARCAINRSGDRWDNASPVKLHAHRETGPSAFSVGGKSRFTRPGGRVPGHRDRPGRDSLVGERMARSWTNTPCGVAVSQGGR
ncbi:MAG: hypothetical protein B6D73_10770 [gamma proteobacterium symbiont of Stewartia floridana]|nr:MAG: hypothetical protein B6D73_10770 [gamma proteobacterium symbiont of Stewartia floridana]